MPERTLGNVVIVEALIVPEHRVEIGPRVEVGRAQDLADAAVESLDQAIRLRAARRREPVLDVMPG